jgi:molybdopterin-guanine dinucleotide biosynthesis protein A
VKSQPQIVAIVLAGGQSSRMGRDKALIEVGGVPLLYKVCAVAQSCANPVYVIAPWVVRYQSIVPTGCQCLTEVPPPGKILPQGPLVAFAQALGQVEGEWVLLLACDLPLLNAVEIGRWCRYLTQVPPGAIALLPRHTKGWEPLCGFYRRRCLSSLQEFIAGGGSSFQEWLARNFVVELSVTDSRLLLNCNSPDDLPNEFS